MSPMITLTEAENLREQLRPAFAGYVTDGNVSNRDVLATLMDLIVREKIGIDMKSQKKPVKVDRIYSLHQSSTLLPFEKEFVRVLFKDSKELTATQARGVMLSGELHKIIRENMGELQKAEIVSSQLLIINKHARVVDLKHEPLIGRVKTVRTIGDLSDYKRSLHNHVKLYKILLIPFLFFLVYSLIFPEHAKSGVDVYKIEIGYIAIFAGILMLTLFDIKKMKTLDKILIFQFKNNAIPYSKKKYEELFDFIRANPLEIQRLHNEFMPHAVAFGLDESWNKSFNLPTEVVVSSRVKSV